MSKADDGDATATVDKGTEETEKVTDAAKDDDQKSSAPGSSADSAAKDDDSDAKDADSSHPDGDEGPKDSEAKKQRNREGYQIRQLIDNNPVVSTIREKLQPWVESAEDERDRKDRSRDVNDYVRDIVKAQDDLQRDNLAVAREVALFNPQSEDFNESLTKRAFAQYARDMIIYDQNGITDKQGNPLIVGYRMGLLDYMREKAEDYGYGGSKPSGTSQDKPGKSKKQSKAEMDAKADTPGGTSPRGNRSANKESFDDLFRKGMDDPYGRHTPKDSHAYS